MTNFYAILRPIFTPVPRQVGLPDRFDVSFRPIGHVRARSAADALRRAIAARIPCPIIEPCKETPQ